MISFTKYIIVIIFFTKQYKIAFFRLVYIITYVLHKRKRYYVHEIHFEIDKL